MCEKPPVVDRASLITYFIAPSRGNDFDGFQGLERRLCTDPIPVGEERLLSKLEFQRLADVPPEAEWFANLTNENTKRAYRNDVGSFMRFVGIARPEDFRSITRAHVIAWRKTLEKGRLAPATLRRKLSALSDLFDYLCEKNAVPDNPVHGVERPKDGANKGKTPALSDTQAAALLDAPPRDTLKGKRDRAILAVLLFHAVRRAELCDLRVKDYGDREGIKHLTVHGKGGKSGSYRRIRELFD